MKEMVKFVDKDMPCFDFVETIIEHGYCKFFDETKTCFLIVPMNQIKFILRDEKYIERYLAGG